MKKKKNVVLVVVGILLLVCLYFGYKGFNLFYYNVDRITTQDYDDFISQFTIKDTMTINHKNVESNDYLEYQNIKIRNDFEDFEKLEQTTGETSLKLILKDENEKTKSSFWMSVADTYVNLLKLDKSLFGTEDKRITNTDLANILEKNKINNDIELFKYLEKQKDIKNNIFTSAKEMKENYTIQFMVSVIMPQMDSITLINGDYQGYIFNLKNNMKEVSILKNGKRYVFMFLNTTYFTDEKINDLLNTIVIG